MQRHQRLKVDPLRHLVAAISVGVWRGQPVVDLDYAEDSSADSDMNVVMAEGGGLIEVQGTAEGAVFTGDELAAMLQLAQRAAEAIFAAQRAALAEG
jgi:ribonuclease PH